MPPKAAVFEGDPESSLRALPNILLPLRIYECVLKITLTTQHSRLQLAVFEGHRPRATILL